VALRSRATPRRICRWRCKKENELFGQDGFEKMVDRVAGLEKQLGIYDLAQFTPRIET
jgi:hypothetical protein